MTKIVKINSKDLSVLAYANGFTLWHCWVPAPADNDWAGPNSWEDCKDIFRHGDIILATCSDVPFWTLLGVCFEEDNLEVLDMLTNFIQSFMNINHREEISFPPFSSHLRRPGKEKEK